MSKKIYLFSLVLLALAFTACSETETVDKYDNWRSRNESFIDSLANVFEAGTDPLLLRIIKWNKAMIIFIIRRKLRSL